MELAEDAHLGSKLSPDTSWAPPADLELVGEAQSRRLGAAPSAPAEHISRQSNWPMVLAIATFAVDVIAVIAGYDLARAILDTTTT